MKRVLVGLRGTTNMIRVDSDVLPDAAADQQLADATTAITNGGNGVVVLPWLTVPVAEILFVRTQFLSP